MAGPKNPNHKMQRSPAGGDKVKKGLPWGALIGAIAIVAILGAGLYWFTGRNTAPDTGAPAPATGTPAPATGTPATGTPATGTGTANPATPEPARKQWSEPPAMAIDVKKQYQAIVTTEEGKFTIDLWPDKAPGTVNNFVFLARQHYYDGVPFHRVIRAFMVQGGDPTGTGTGGPGYRIKDELPVPGSYDVGVVAMAKTDKPDSGGSQFFICTGPTCKNLDQQPVYTQFGKVSDMTVVQKIAATPTGPNDRPVKLPHILSVDIVEK